MRSHASGAGAGHLTTDLADIYPYLQGDLPWGVRLPRDNQGENVATIKMRMPRRLAAL